jgi:hypothetical protein
MGDPTRRVGSKAQGTQGTIALSPPSSSIEVTHVDSPFAPLKESSAISFTLAKGKTLKALSVWIRGTKVGPGKSPQKDNVYLFKGELKGAELPKAVEGVYVYKWNGAVSEGEALASLLEPDGEPPTFVSPLYSPYTVELRATFTDGSLGTSAPLGAVDTIGVNQIEVLYHSVELKTANWTPDEPTEAGDPVRWLQVRLNVLGFHAGPPDGTFGEELRRALTRYCLAHPRLVTKTPPASEGDVSGELRDALRASEGERKSILVSSRDPNKYRVFIDANVFSDHRNKDNENQEESAEVNNKSTAELELLNRPTVPLQAEVKLVRNSGEAVSVPEAVGPLLFKWTWESVEDNVSKLPTAADGHTRRYFRAARERVATKLKAWRATDVQPEALGGIFPSDRADAFAVPFASYGEGFYYKPFKRNRGVYTKAWSRVETHEGVLGTSPILFRPSTIAGDGFRVSVAVSFANRRNKESLDASHETLKPLKASRTFRVWRRIKSAVHLHWSEVKPPAYDWADVQEAYRQCYVYFLPPREVVSIRDYLSQADLDGVLAAASPTEFKSAKYPSSWKGYEKAFWVWDGKTKEPVLKAKVEARIWDSVKELMGVVSTDLGELLDRRVRQEPPRGKPTRPEGLILIDYQPCVAKVANAPSKALSRGSVLISLTDVRSSRRGLWTHEIGHTLFLRHTGKVDPAQAWDHDTSDDTCVMTYPPGDFFCGKCNLKLRGINLRGRHPNGTHLLPDTSSPD